jgi:hypothetical protein
MKYYIVIIDDAHQTYFDLKTKNWLGQITLNCSKFYIGWNVNLQLAEVKIYDMSLKNAENYLEKLLHFNGYIPLPDHLKSLL